MKLDHLFVMTRPGAPERAQLEALGLVETFRREHPGQGTTNICYAFDNAFLELLWMYDRADAESEPIRRTGLSERARWRETGASPFGVAWRCPSTEQRTIETWAYTPPYMPAGMSIPVATWSDDARNPMLFESPGRSAPREWPPEMRGALQHAAGFTTLRVEVSLPMSETASRTTGPLRTLAEHGAVSVAPSPDDQLHVSAVFLRADGSEGARLALPLD